VTDSAPLPLAGLRVVEIASEISGPYAGKLLVDAGAEVIKVEPPGGDPMRRWTASGHPITGDEDGALFQYLNASKKSVLLDLESDAGRADLIRLASASDLLIEDLGPGGLADLGLAAAIQNARPELSIVSLSAWGGEGPDARRPATEFTQQAAAGSIAYRGLRDRAPVAAGGRLGEWALGVFAAVGALTASGMARASGRGQIVDASRFEAMLLCLTVYHDLDGQWNADPLPRSIEIPSIERAKDGWVGFCTVTGQQWVDLCTLMGRSDVGENQDYLAAMKRMDDMDFIKGVIEGWTLEHTIDEILELCAAFRIPASPIGNGQTLLENEHLVAREVFQNSPGGFMQPRPPYLIEDSGHRPLGRAPKLGEHDVGALLADATPPSVQGATGEPKRLLLEGLKVVDLTAFWAGPLAACFLADMGADVVKIESIQRPDGMRFAGAVPNAEMWEWSPVFHGANPGKRDVTLHLESERGMTAGGLELVLWIESALGIVNCYEICRGSERVAAVAFGAEDFTHDMAIERLEGDRNVEFARNTICIAARAAGVLALDTPYFHFRDKDGLVENAQASKTLGFKGKFAIHPAQVDTINRVFSPSKEEIDLARQVVAAYEEAERQGRGSTSLDGKVIDVPVYKRAKALLASQN